MIILLTSLVRAISSAIEALIANTDVYKGSFFPQTIRDWNTLPDSLISSAEDMDDYIANFCGKSYFFCYRVLVALWLLFGAVSSSSLR